MNSKKDFDKVYLGYNSFMQLFNLYREKEILEMLSLNGEERIIDIGAGTGYIAKHLSKHCKEIYILDESPKMLSRLKENDSIKTKVGNALDTKFKDNFFDIVLLTDVFHHIKDQNRLLNEIYRILKPDGRVLIYDFDLKCMKTKILKLFESILFGFKKLYFQDITAIEEIFQKNNFSILQRLKNGFYFISLWRKV